MVIPNRCTKQVISLSHSLPAASSQILSEYLVPWGPLFPRDESFQDLCRYKLVNYVLSMNRLFLFNQWVCRDRCGKILPYTRLAASTDLRVLMRLGNS